MKAEAPFGNIQRPVKTQVVTTEKKKKPQEAMNIIMIFPFVV